MGKAKKEKEENHALEQAKAQLESITEMVEALRAAVESEYKNVREKIQEDPLSVEVRSGWHTPGVDGGREESEFKILLCTGGPAVQIVGNLSEHGEPESATLQYQDWGTPWTLYPISGEEEETILEYCREFYFGS